MARLNFLKKIMQRIVGRRSENWGDAVKYTYKRVSLNNLYDDALDVQRIKNITNYAKKSLSSNEFFDAGYQDIEVRNIAIKGARSGKQRLELLDIDFSGKFVLDLGCNQGSILFSVADKIAYGVGTDFDYKVINVSHALRDYGKVPNLNFFLFDLDKDPFDNLLDFFPSNRIDVIFLLAVCAHIAKWRELIQYCASVSPVLVFEANGSEIQKLAQIDELKRNYKKVNIIYNKSIDDGGNRSLYIAQN